MIDYHQLLKAFIRALIKETGNSQVAYCLPSLTREEGIELVRILDNVIKDS